VKRGTPNHPKTRELAAALDLPQYAAVGILEALWHFAAVYARRGDVGRRSDAAIAAAIDWRGEPGILVDALVRSGWLDRCACHRLRIHDWPEHADRAVAKTEDVKRQGWLECYASDPALPASDAGTHACAPRADDVHTPDARVHTPDARVHTPDARVQHTCAPPLPLPLPLPEPNGPPPTPPASGGERIEPPADVHGPPGRRAGPVVVGTSPAGPTRRQRAQALRDDADALERYWIRLGGHPNPRDRRRLRDSLRAGHSPPKLRGSIAELVREALVAAGQLGAEDPWPPPGLAPYDGILAGERLAPAEVEP
jgi:hypothetical protein